MEDLGTNSTTPLDHRSTLESSLGSTLRSSEGLPQPPTLAHESSDRFNSWKTIGEQQEFYDEKDFLYPNCNLTSEELKNRKENDVVIFDYSLNGTDGNPEVEAGGPSSRRFSEEDDIFFLVPKDKLIGSKEFNQIINPRTEPQLIRSRGPRLAIIDFPQCYDTYDDVLLNSMAQELHLQNAATFGDAHSKRVLALPGRERFRTGISLRVPAKKSSELSKSGSCEDRSIFFVSFPYFGKSGSITSPDPKNESVELLDFNRLGVDVPDRSAAVGPKGKGDIGEILVHQARYMIFDNYTMATFISKEDSARNQVPLYHLQQCTGAFHVTIQMIANRTGSEVWALEKLQASLCKLEEDINQMILDAKSYEDTQGRARILMWDERPRRSVTRRGLRDLLASLNRLSAGLFASIMVAERQITILQDIQSIFSISYRRKTRDRKEIYPLRQNPFQNIALAPISLGNPEQIWPDTLDTIDEVIRERKRLIEKIKMLVENMGISKEILFEFLKSDNVKEAVQAATRGMVGIEDSVKEVAHMNDGSAELAVQAIQLAIPSVIFLAFLPLSFFTSYYGMNNIKEFDGKPISLAKFWAVTGPVSVGGILLIVIIVLWKRRAAIELRSQLKEKLGQSAMRRRYEADIEGDLRYDPSAPSGNESYTGTC
ncbi:hypothetical protein B9Z19DRAFT_1081323 [Tuber borchii]|uniref:Uncharacterized protein n=1 Tax=Tuber borchii TaxID=42251 RepID=A0A2T6ZVU5_TUBBO|nr:hypothetical protein B9Z19DRAFT_1081323 [Tuber borchii]